MLPKKVTHGRVKGEKKPSTFNQKKPFKGKEKNRKGSKKDSALGRTINSKRIKPKPNSKNPKIITAEDKKYLEYLKETNYGCFVCGKTDSIEWHHVKLYSSDKKDHKRLIPLCGEEHHRTGKELSPHGTPTKWRETYSMKVQNAFADEVYKKYEKEILCKV